MQATDSDSTVPDNEDETKVDVEAAQEAKGTTVKADETGETTSTEFPSAPNQPQAPKAVNDLSPALCAAKLAELFPALFGPAGSATPGAAPEPPKPLKLRIQADIQQRAPGVFSKKSLSIFLSRYTTGNAYIRALLAAPHRFDLDGQPAGEISEEHIAAAKEEMARRRAIHEERRAAEREAQRQARNVARQQGPADAPHEPPHGPPSNPSSKPPRGPRRERHDAGHAPHAERGPRPPRRPRASHPPEGPRAAQPAQSARSNAPPQSGHAPTPRAAETHAGASHSDDPARRERATLLRLYEASSLTKANFCVLKRISETELDAQLELARQERGPAPRR
jgi:sRNA-binding protein